MAALLAQGRNNICWVSAMTTSQFTAGAVQRSATFWRFEKDFPGAKVVRLEQNYRSTQQILSAASHMIAVNQGRLGKTLWTEAEGGEPIRIHAVGRRVRGPVRR